MTLKEYKEAEGLDMKGLAKKLKLSVGHTSDIVNARSDCSLKVAVRIEKLTEGAVSCRDLLTKAVAR